MPVILRWKGYRFFFFSNEGDPLEPVHIHVRKAEAIAKFWLEPDIILAESYGLSGKELGKLVEVIYENRELIRERWDEFFKL